MGDNGDGAARWTLGNLVPTEGTTLVGRKPGFTAVRVLTDDEPSELRGAYEDLSVFNLNRLVVNLHVAGGDFIRAVDDGLASGRLLKLDVTSTTQVHERFEATLAAFTSSHRRVESAAAHLGGEGLAATKADFSQLRHENAQYLLMWQLRNLAQHHRSPSDFLEVGRVCDTECLAMNLGDLFEYVASLDLRRNHRRAWDDLSAAWANSERQIDALACLVEARRGYDLLVARMLGRSARHLNAQVGRVITAYAAGSAVGRGAVAVRRDVGGFREQWFIDPRSFEGAMLTLNWGAEVTGVRRPYQLPDEGLFPEPPEMVWAEHRQEE